MSDSVFVARDETHFMPTELARGPWDAGAQHGGAPAALLMRALEQLDNGDDLMLARVTYEFVRPVPLTELSVSTEVARSGRRTQLLEGSITAERREVVRARAVRVMRTDVDDAGPASGEPAASAAPNDGRPNDYPRGDQPMFATDAMEIRFVEGQFRAKGPAKAWFRLRVPLVEGEQPSSLQRLAAAADFGNGISAALSWDEYLFINPDLTLVLERDPEGDWMCLDSLTRVARGGIGAAESVLYDQRGRVGRAVQTLVVARR